MGLLAHTVGFPLRKQKPLWPQLLFREANKMLLANSIQVKTDSLILDEPSRQRTNHDVEDIIPSISARGIYNPIIVDRTNNKIVAGARRWLAACKLFLETVPVRFADELTPVELQIVELEENLRRKDLEWKDLVLSIYRIHEIFRSQAEGWTIISTGEQLNLSSNWVSRCILVSKEILEGNKKVLAANSMATAYGLITRNRERRVEDAVADMATVLADDIKTGQNEAAGKKGEKSPSSSPSLSGPAGISESGRSQEIASRVNSSHQLAADSILAQSFLDFAPTYSSQPFNLIHCDFPYGVGMDKSEQGQAEKWGSYEDTEEVYEKLIMCLCQNLDKLMASSGHLLFWLSADLDIIHGTYDRFALDAPSLDFWPKPLIWHKTDNKGIVSDAQRGPRHVYEACLFASRGDRKIIKTVSDVYGCPTDKTFHQSTKPEPMLRHFLSMVVDENTRLLDPTCGSGTALRAAESLGAKVVLGLELNNDYAEQARGELRRFRLLRKAEKVKA